MAASSRRDRANDAPAETFARAREALARVQLRPEIVRDDAPAPKRLAPYAVAVTADLYAAARERAELTDHEELATGRFVLLYDPAGHAGWQGTFRVVTYVRAALDAEMAAEPVLAGVSWSWLLEALSAHGVSYVAPSGTVTRVASESFGGIAGEVAEAELEVRASWTPTDDDLGASLEAWAELLAQVGGLPPVAAGVVPLPRGTSRPAGSRRT